jgi:hypothetical protein
MVKSHPSTASGTDQPIDHHHNHDNHNQQIGVILRDSYGIPQVRSITGSKVLRLLKKNSEC